ncbi:MAG: RIP metalloprotease RseP [Clostridiaceae bacterium]|nr:RIP metalloprotease RseP [Clostridiaceae bacterium]
MPSVSIIISIIITLFGLGILAAVHEIGHFLVARAFGIKVYELSIFVGPALFSWRRKEVDYSIRLIPFGAYVRFSDFDEQEQEKDDENPNSLKNQPRWKRIIVALAGPAMNIVLGIMILTILFSATGFLSMRQAKILEGTQIGMTDVQEGDRITKINGAGVFTVYDFDASLALIPFDEPIDLTLKSSDTGKSYSVTLIPDVYDVYMLGITRLIDDTVDGWPIYAVDPMQNNSNPVIKVNDILLTVNGVSVLDESVMSIIMQSQGQALTVTYIRDGVLGETQIVPMLAKQSNPRGIIFQEGEGFAEAFVNAVKFPFSMVRLVGLTFQGAISGEIEAYNIVTGPVGITTMVSDVVDAPDVSTSIKAEILFLLLGVISIGLAITNLLPIPGLDGNEIILLLVELVRGKKLGKKAEMVINAIGFGIIIILVFAALLSDIIRMTR